MNLKISLRTAMICLLLTGVSMVSAAPEERVIRVATTTSTVNSGLMRQLVPAFEKKSRYKIRLLVSGTGKAMRLARDGHADLLMVHAPAAEKKFMEKGHAQSRDYLMYNDFILAGPASDPVAVRSGKDIVAAFKKISGKATFVSRGDDSGTHKKELSVWREAQIEPFGIWYFEAGMGMGDVLKLADLKQAYVLADRGTWLALRNTLSLKLLIEGDKRLHNPYHIMIVSKKRHKDANLKGAMAFRDWLLSVEAKNIINGFRVDKERLFVFGGK